MSAPEAGRRPYGAAIVIVVGLLLGSTGGAFAAATINGSRIQTGAVTSGHLADGSVTLADLDPAARARFRGPRGAAGAPGAEGPAGEQGTDGEAGTQGSQGGQGNQGATGAGGVSGWELTTSTATGGADLTQSCPNGKVILSANAYWSVSEFAPGVSISSDRTATAIAVGGASSSDQLVLQLVCAEPS